MAENLLSSDVKRYVNHVWYVLRMKSKTERKELPTKLIDAMPTMDVRPFVKVVNNIVSSLGSITEGRECIDPDMVMKKPGVSRTGNNHIGWNVTFYNILTLLTLKNE